MLILRPLLALAISAGLASVARADINVGVPLSTTGPLASLGIPMKNSLPLMPRSIGGEKVNYIVLDDGSDTTTAVTNTRKLIAEHKVDVIIGEVGTPISLAITDVVAEAQVPTISMGASAGIVEPVEGKKRWLYKTAQSDIQMALAIVSHMANNGVRTMAYLGFADAFGENYYAEIVKAAALKKVQIVANERFNRTDTSVAGQVLKILSARPDAVMIGGVGTPAALPQKTLKDLGYTGKIYHTHGVANNDFLRVCGKDCEGALLPTGPMVVADQLPDSHPVKKSALVYVRAYEGIHGKGSSSAFGGLFWDAGLLLADAAPRALKKAKPGTVEFRAALRDELEKVKNLGGANGIFNLSPGDHNGLDQRAVVMVKVEKGTWKYQP